MSRTFWESLSHSITTIAFAVWISGCGFSTSATAQDFRIDSEVYLADVKKPVSHSITLFSERLIVDFLMSEDDDLKAVEVVIFDSQQRRLVLLDMDRKIRTEITDLQLEKVVESLSRELQNNDATRFLTADSWVHDTDWSSNTVTMTSPNIVYQFRGTQPDNAAILPRYVEFLDNFTKLNATDPRKLPPFPRMKLNQKIKQLGWIPSEVRVTVKANDFVKEEIDARSKHRVTPGLSGSDKEWIANAKRDWVQLKEVDLKEYRGLVPSTVTSARPESARLK